MGLAEIRKFVVTMAKSSAYARLKAEGNLSSSLLSSISATMAKRSGLSGHPCLMPAPIVKPPKRRPPMDKRQWLSQ